MTTESSEENPKVFISYSHDSGIHVDWVRRFAEELRAAGVDAILDQWDLSPGQDLAHFMEQGISNSDRVILVCSDKYVQKADAGAGGVGYEKMIVTKEIVANIATNKFLPILRGNSSKSTPGCLGTRIYIDFDDDDKFSEQMEELLRAILEAPRHPKPPLGAVRFSKASTTRISGIQRNVLKDPWFEKHRRGAIAKVRSYSPGVMELSFGASSWNADVDQGELLNAAERAAIHTFGWPIGVVLHTEDGRPRPIADGVVAQIESTGFSDRARFDYWALRKNGDFYLARNLFEDGRKAGALFFDTRMVRVAESLMYCRNLFGFLGCPPGVPIHLRFVHSGLKGRQLMAASPNRTLAPVKRVCADDEVEQSVVMTHSATDADIVDLTKQVLKPLFMLFDYFKPADVVYEEVVRTFMSGRTS
ncbi:MAG: toll/interleukin-1 receptor domain-containing protein [Parvularcula sp.]|jgi:hypothetical protein|nr:toll/interleukin-1 receptor domain-containing protein [Parvularcula sp.]